MHNNENMKLIKVASFVDLGQTWELRICLIDPKVKGLSRARNGPSSVPAYSSTVASEKTHGLKISYKALSLLNIHQGTISMKYRNHTSIYASSYGQF